MDEKEFRESISEIKERTTRLEEQMKTVYNKTDRIEIKLDELIEKVSHRDIDVATNQLQIGQGERLFWVGLSAVIGLVIYWIKG